MQVAVAKRPVEQFDTEAQAPTWQLEPDEEAWGYNYVDSEPLVDPDGNPIDAQPADPLAPQSVEPQQQEQTDEWLDEVLRRNPENRPQPAERQPPRQPSEPQPDPLQPRP
jgi:penicillin-binding protein 1A